MRKFLGVFTLVLLMLMVVGCGDNSSSRNNNNNTGANAPGGGTIPGSGSSGQQFLYVANAKANTISAFTVGSDGTLTTNSTVTAKAIGIAADGKGHVYSAGGSEVDGFSINSDGSLKSIGNWTRTDPGGPVAPGLLTLEPGGTQLYAQIYGPDQGIQTFTINSDGSLSDTNNFLSTGVGKPEFTSDGRTAYAPLAYHLDSELLWLSRDATTGALRQGGAYGYPDPVGLGRVAISPNGNLVAESLPNGQVAIFTVDQNRALAPVNGSPFSFGGTFGAAAWSANGQFLLVASDRGVRVFRVDANGGATEVTGQPGPTGMTNVVATGTNLVFATSASAGTVTSYRLDPNSGMLTVVSASNATGAGAGEMAIASK